MRKRIGLRRKQQDGELMEAVGIALKHSRRCSRYSPQLQGGLELRRRKTGRKNGRRQSTDTSYDNYYQKWIANAYSCIVGLTKSFRRC